MSRLKWRRNWNLFKYGITQLHESWVSLIYRMEPTTASKFILVLLLIILFRFTVLKFVLVMCCADPGCRHVCCCVWAAHWCHWRSWCYVEVYRTIVHLSNGLFTWILTVQVGFWICSQTVVDCSVVSILCNDPNGDQSWLQNTPCVPLQNDPVTVSNFQSRVFTEIWPSVLWRCCLGGRKGIRTVKNWVVRCWRGYLSGARCRLAYGPADATATHCLLLQ